MLEQVKSELGKILLAYFLDRWEERVMSLKISEIGAIILDRQMRLFSNLANEVIGVEPSKSLLQRFGQIVAVINCNSIQEVSELAAKSGPGQWVLRDSQIREILKLRSK